MQSTSLLNIALLMSGFDWSGSLAQSEFVRIIQFSLHVLGIPVSRYFVYTCIYLYFTALFFYSVSTRVNLDPYQYHTFP